MKATVLFIAILGLALLVVPMIALNVENQSGGEQPAEIHIPALLEREQPEEASVPPAGEIQPEGEQPQEQELEPGQELETVEAAVSAKGVEAFTILDETTGEIYQVPVRDYVRGAVAAEMPVSFHQEALKAQAVAAHTYALYNHYLQQESPDPALRGADFSADPQNRKGFLTQEQAVAFFGEDGSRHWNTVCRAADSVLEYIMEYEDEPIVAAYHAMSAGMTEDAGNVWMAGVPYLQPVESEGDLLAPNYEQAVHLSVEEVRQTLLAHYPDMELPSDPGTWFLDEERSLSGYITALRIGGEELHGKEIRTMFDLRSHNLDIAYNDAGFTFTTFGYGHGVGLSQYGADFLARQGYTFEEILTTYYQGIALKKVDVEL